MNTNQASSDPHWVLSQIRETMACLGYSQLSDVNCHWEEDQVVLRGELDSFYLKQVAQSVAIKISGSSSVRNEISVV